MKNYNKQKQMYCFIQLIQLISQSLVQELYSVQRATDNACEIFRNLGYIYDALQLNIN